MNAMVLAAARSISAPAGSTQPARHFDLDDDAAYQRWRAAKMAGFPASIEDLIVALDDPRALTALERAALLDRCARANMVIYRSPVLDEDKTAPRALGRQLGLNRLDLNWLADDDGISRIAVSDHRDQRGGFIPYTDRPIRWHTDGYYQSADRRIESVILHCVRPASAGGANALLDHEMAYIALRDADPDWVRALTAPDAMTVPARLDEAGVARPAQSGAVFSAEAGNGVLHMRYTARTRSIVWKTDPLIQQALGFLERLLASETPWIFRIRLEAGMGIVSGNVLHDREAFIDDPKRPRLLYRARYVDPIDRPDKEDRWPSA